MAEFEQGLGFTKTFTLSINSWREADHEAKNIFFALDEYIIISDK